jgi:serine/threonine protein kinase
MGECEARRIFQQIIAGVEHCHENRVAHRDLKPENIFLDKDRNVKIGDFGLSGEMLEGASLRESCGSPNYAAPELFYKNCEYDGPEVDVWSCGVILYALLCNKLPFDADSIPELIRIIKRGKYSVPGFVSDDAKDLIAQMLCKDPKQRITTSAIRKHHWFAKDLPPELAKKSPVHEAVVAVEPESEVPSQIIIEQEPAAPCGNSALLKAVCTTDEFPQKCPPPTKPREKFPWRLKDVRHDFGASLLPHFCTPCGKSVLNRGCEACGINLCRTCFDNHICPVQDQSIATKPRATECHRAASTLIPCVSKEFAPIVKSFSMTCQMSIERFPANLPYA